MHRFWDVIIGPIFKILEPKSIIEIGVGECAHTKKLLWYCSAHDAHLHVIDPRPCCDLQSLTPHHSRMTFYEEESLSVLPKINQFDVVLIDGDHNWYTVYHELQLIRQSKQKDFPLIFLHDVGWPYGHRDLYYNPEYIPEEYRHPYKNQGISLETGLLVEKGGLNPNLNHAVTEAKEKNGVLCAVNDFIRDTDLDFDFIQIPCMHGLGILAPKKLLKKKPKLATHLEKLKIPHILENLIALQEKNFLLCLSNIQKNNEKFLSAERALRLSEKEREKGMAYQKILEEDQNSLKEDNEELKKKNEELKKKNEELKKKHAGLHLDLQTMQMQLDRTTHSKSWKWTVPLRKIGMMTKGKWPMYIKEHCTKLMGKTRESRDKNNNSENPLDTEYKNYICNHALTQELYNKSKDHAAKLHYKPLVSVIIPLYKSDELLLRKAISSVEQQSYDNWEIVLVNDGIDTTLLDTIINDYPNISPDRIQKVQTGTGKGISVATNAGAKVARGEYLAFLDHDDILELDALEKVVSAINAEESAPDLLYTDHDKITERGSRYDPEFKPDWSPELLLTYSYIGHLKVVRRELFLELGGFRSEFDGSQDYDFFLRLSEKTDKVVHIPHVLYHWRSVPGSTALSSTEKPTSIERGKRALEEALQRRGIGGTVIQPKFAEQSKLGIFQIQYDGNHLKDEVTIIIPTKNQFDLIKRCITSIKKNTTYPHYNILVIDNGSTDKRIFRFLKGEKVPWITVETESFNFSYINNLAVEQVSSPLVLFLNDDIQIVNSEWLTEMVGALQLHNKIGAVGAKLLYPDNRVQHNGVSLGLCQKTAGHINKFIPADETGYLYSNMVMRNTMAVTGACLLTHTHLFKKYKGFDQENFAVSFNDVDYCFTLHKNGYRIVCNPSATLLHYEGVTRKETRESEKWKEEKQNLRSKWNTATKNDPYHNPNLLKSSGPIRIRNNRRGTCLRFISHNLNLEGSSIALFELAKGLKQRNFDILVNSPADGPLMKQYRDEGIPVAIGGYAEIAATMACGQEMDATIVNTLSVYPLLNKIDVDVHNIIWWIHESERQTYMQNNPDLDTKLLKEVARLVFPCQATKAIYHDCNQGHSHTIYNGIDVSKYNPTLLDGKRQKKRMDLGLKDEDVLIVTVGTICSRKGQKEFVKAAHFLTQKLPHKKLHFLMVGGGYDQEYEKEVVLAIRKYDLEERVKIIQKTEDVHDYYAAADIFVCNSYIESFPLVILEAMAHSLPIVASNTYGIPEQIQHGREGLLYTPGNVHELVQALTTLINNPLEAKIKASSANRKLRELFSHEKMIDAFEQLIAPIFDEESAQTAVTDDQKEMQECSPVR